MYHVTLQQATQADLPLIMQYITEAQDHLKEQGIDQWQDGYPNAEGIATDIATQKGFLICQNAQGVGYLCIDFTPEPAYAVIRDGAWHTDSRQYCVVHRLAIGRIARGTGLARAVFALVDKYCIAHSIPNFRIDTHPDNHKMQHLLKAHGFSYCGIVDYTSGVRFAYDKQLTI